MKNNRYLKYLGLAAAALLLGGATLAVAQTADVTIQSFDANASGVGINWGSSTFIWDATEGNPVGSLKVTATFSSASDTPFMPFICYNGGNPWYNAGTFDFSLYKSIDFDIKWDPTSDITIAQFNDLSTWDTTMTNKNGSFIMQSWAGSGYLAGSTSGFDVQLCGPGVQAGTTLTNMNIPAAAASGWTHVSIPIDPTKSGLAGMSGITLHKWINKNWGIASNAQARVWIDNIVLKGTAGPPPPPTVLAPTTKATPGLNVFASTAGLYDRQEAVLRQTSGLSWVGHATAGNPVTYSFTIVGYPKSVNCEAYLFLIPNPAYLDGAPDWNETNCAIVYLQGSSTGATGHFQYKVGEPGNQLMYGGAAPYTNAPGSWDGVTANYLESGNLAQVTNATTGVFGTWTLSFTSDTAGTLTSPDGHSTNFIFPAYNVGYFAEQTSPGFYVYLGMQANNADALNQAVVYSNFAITGVASPYSENFLADTVLDTTNTWNTSPSAGPNGVLIVPATAALWLQWTLPDTAFSLEASPTLTGGALAWTSPSIGPVIGMVGIRSQLVASSELPAGNAAFFRLIKRVFTQLQVLLPGETNAPNTLTGKTGTPTPVNVNDLVNVTVNAVDATWNIVNVSGDTINLTTTDGTAITPLDAPLVNGTLTGQIQFGSSGSFTVTASDTTNTNIPPSISASLTVN